MEQTTEQLENYSQKVDAFNKKLNKEIPEKLQPIMAKFLETMLDTASGQPARDEAIAVFSKEVHSILSDGLKDFLTIQFETHFLKFAVSEELGDIITRLEQQYGDSFQKSQKFLKDFIDDFSDDSKIDVFNETVRRNELKTKGIISELMEQKEKNRR